jgi:hypothetical protein
MLSYLIQARQHNSVIPKYMNHLNAHLIIFPLFIRYSQIALLKSLSSRLFEQMLVGCEILTAVVMKIPIPFWDIALCSLYMNQCSGRMYHLHFQG